ncbi:DUF6328 family protein [Nannocystis sp. ILAH1]|uniref:DUF6328 family protein n=1 Tax=unclassified Nannocystis TaxID=2627009 RepID=UPI00226FBF4F|nr:MULTISPECIES: DUF6328 family protein [unclassified Nannocystis]MCY0987131.1 DUF6328 family protein [Nannocystis sp. ILAH1]MCY1072014.1 DUF6328 family protein [Nannocystis sp. RBIL2]
MDHKDTDPRQDEPQEVPAQLGQIFAEANMILPGVLSLLGLQVISTLNDIFLKQLGPVEHGLHLAAFILLAVGLALVVTPAAYHRQTAPYGIPAGFARLATIYATLGLVPLMLAVSIDLYIITSLITKSVAISLILSGSLLAVFVGLWLVFPQVVAAQRRAQAAEESRGDKAAPREPR